MALKRLALVAMLVLPGTAALADDLTGSDQILCSAGKVTACTEDGQCFTGTAFDLNMPQFVQVDLVAKRLSTTKASTESRATDIRNLVRQDGKIVMQGSDRGRVFSFVIDEGTGFLTAAIAMDGMTASVFGACTPMPAGK